MIEILVVIAIIGILATIILIPLSQISLKARNAAIKDDINQVRVIAEDVLDDNGGATYCVLGQSCVTTDPRVLPLAADIDRQNGNAGGEPVIQADANFCVEAVFADAKTYCADSSGGFTGSAAQAGTSGTCVNTLCQ